MAASPPHTDGSVVFAKWQQCAAPMYYSPLGIRGVSVLPPAESL